MKKNIYFLRHGESLENVKKIYFDDLDTPLTSDGVLQAQNAAERMESINLDIVFSSPYDRAQKTASKIAINSDVKAKVLDFAYERLYPNAVYGLEKKSEEVKKIKSDFKTSWIENPERLPADGSESFVDFKKRVGKILEEAEKSPFENIAFVLHGGLLRAVALYVLTDGDFSAEEFFRFFSKMGYSNTGLSLFEFDSEKKKNNQWKIKVWNDHSHL